LTVGGRKMNHRARVARHRENVVRKNQTRNQAIRGTLKRRKDGKRLWKCPECKNGIRDRGLRQQLQGRMRIKNPGTRRQLHLKIEGTSDRIDK
jgi:hypothetical protein